MRSLWRLMALRWLGGEGSEALTGDSALLNLLPSGEAGPVFHVVRDPRARAPTGTESETPVAVEREDLDPAVRRRT